MDAQLWLIEPNDPLFFRDSRPFTAGETDFATGIFPPMPSTLYGAVRSWLLLANPAAFDRFRKGKHHLLGSPCEPGSLRIAGPFLHHDKWGLLFPAPADIVIRIGSSAGKRTSGETEDFEHPHQVSRKKLCRLPDRCDMRCFSSSSAEEPPPLPDSSDNGKRKPPVCAFLTPGCDVTEDPWRPATNCWITLDGLSAYLKGLTLPPGALILSRSLWRSEEKIGIQRNHKSRTTVYGMLYRIAQTRLRPGVRLALFVDGLGQRDDDLKIPKSPVRFGGEGRTVSLEVTKTELPRHSPPRSGERYTLVYLATPLVLPASSQSRESLLRYLERVISCALKIQPPANIIAAAIKGYSHLSGWDIDAKFPKETSTVIAAGSVFVLNRVPPSSCDPGWTLLQEEIKGRVCKKDNRGQVRKSDADRWENRTLRHPHEGWGFALVGRVRLEE